MVLSSFNNGNNTRQSCAPIPVSSENARMDSVWVFTCYESRRLSSGTHIRGPIEAFYQQLTGALPLTPAHLSLVGVGACQTETEKGAREANSVMCFLHFPAAATKQDFAVRLNSSKNILKHFEVLCNDTKISPNMTEARCGCYHEP